MALRIVRRWSWVPLLACVGGLLQACSSSDVADDDSASSGCSKDSDCREGRICENKVCVTDPNNGAVLGGSSGSGGTTTGSGGSSAAASGGTGFATGGTSAKGGTGSGGSSGSASGSANGGSSSGTGGTGGSAAGTGGSSGTSGTCSVDDPATCPTADSMTFCSNGMLVTYACSEYCDTLGFPVGPCAAPDGCACEFDNPTDEDCLAATNAVCGCLEGSDTPCVEDVDPADPDSVYFYPPYIYASCHGGVPEDVTFFHCIADQTKLDPAPTCGDAFEACGVDTGTAGAGG